jgi:hypothetical protein
VSAVTAILAATACCLPTGALLAAAGLAGASTVFSKAQPYLLAVAVLALAVGLVQAMRAKQCSRSRRRVNLLVLGLSALVVLPPVLLPQYSAAWLTDSLFTSGRTASGKVALRTLAVTDLRRLFNEAVGQTRVIAMFSPT